jgi:hypothetical protein
MRDSRLGFGRFQPMSPWALRGYLAVLVAGAVAILLGVRLGSDLSSQAFLGISLGVYGLCFVVADLLRHVATLGREIEKLKEQSPKKPAEASLTSTPGDLPARIAGILKAYESELYLAPSIPPKKLANATTKACVPADEKVLGLIDCTILGSASSCLVFGSRGFYYSDGGNSNPGGAAQTSLAQDRETRTAIVGTGLDRFGELGLKIAQFQSKLKRICKYVPGSVAYSEFPRCRFTRSGLFYIRLDKDRYSNQAGSKVSRGKIIDILDAIKQAVVEVEG